MVVTIIALLVALSVFLFGNWRQRSATNVVSSDLRQLSSALETYRNVNNDYPATSADYAKYYNSKDSSTINYRLIGNGYCAEATAKSDPTVIMSIRNNQSEPQSGKCT